MNLRKKLAISLFAVGLLALGCDRADNTTVDVAPVTDTQADASATPETPAAPTTNEDKSPDVAEVKKMSAAVAVYAPPFPERIELFEPPQRAQSTARRDNELGAAVELKGFIYVDEPRVVLSIDGVVSSVPVGGEKYGVQVISIEPPTVVLQRGRDRWPATLE